MEQEIFPPPLESCNSDNKTNNNPRDIAIVLSKVSTKKRSHKRKENSTAPQLLYNKLLKELYEPGITPKTILSNGEHADVFAIKYLIKTTEDYKRRFKKCKRKKEENLTQEQKKQKKEDKEDVEKQRDQKKKLDFFGKSMATSRGMTTTQQSELLKLFRKQLVDVCGMSLLQIFQKTVLGYDSENKVRDVSSLEIEALHEIIQISRTSSSHQNQFKRRLQEDFVCKDLPTIICNLIRSEIQFLNIRGACVPQEPISILWNFLLRKSFEYPILLHTKDDKVGTIVELFKQKCLEVFDAECLLPNICGAADNNMTTTFNHNKNNNNSSNFGAMNPQLQEQAKQLVLQSSMLDENLLFLGKKKRTE